MKERDTLAEHDWQLAEDQTLPTDRDFNPGTHVWQCVKCLEKTYLREKPPPILHRKRPDQIRGMKMNWDGLDDIDRMGCSEIVIKDIHES
jgi:hypothetical protein